MNDRFQWQWRIHDLTCRGRANWCVPLCGLILMLVYPGCGGPSGVKGGTEGILHSGGDRLAELQITIHQVEGSSTKPIGFGESRVEEQRCQERS